MSRTVVAWGVLAVLVSMRAEARADYLFTTIDVPAADERLGFGTQAFGINDAGQVVGSYFDLQGGLHSFLLSNGHYTTFDPVGAGSQAFGINNRGQIVGTYTENTGISHGYVLSGGSYTSLDLPDSFNGPYGRPHNTSARGINDAGQVAGSFTIITSLRPPMEHSGGFFLNGGTYTNITEPRAVSGSIATGINNAGQVVGSSSTGGYLLSGGTYTDLNVPGSLTTHVWGINDAGQIVGNYDTYLDGPSYGFVLSDGNYTSFGLAGAYATLPCGINNAGEIVGSYIDAAGAYHGFVATPAPVPEPATLLLAAVCAVCLLGWTSARRWLG